MGKWALLVFARPVGEDSDAGEPEAEARPAETHGTGESTATAVFLESQRLVVFVAMPVTQRIMEWPAYLCDDAVSTRVPSRG